MTDHVLAVIPARGGSKGIPGKNLRDVGGVSLLARAVRTARDVPGLGRTVVSTDDPDIAAAAAAEDCEVVDRPANLARDDTRTEPVLLHAVDTMAERGFRADWVVTLEPTSPLRTAASVQAVVERARKGDVDAVMTVTEDRGVLGRLDDEGRYDPLFPDAPRRRQEREPLYREAGVAYATRVDALRTTGHVLATGRPGAVVVDAMEAVDINEPLDLALAEVLIRQRPTPKEESQ